MIEEWRQIKHPEGLYEVSNMGRIRSLRFINGKTNRLRTVPLVRKPVRQNTGYLCVLLSDGSRPNGIKCPLCKTELHDSEPMVVFTSNPAQMRIHCPKCGYSATRIA